MPLKQYVNLDPNVADQLKGLDKKRAGKFVTFKAKLDKAVPGVPIMVEMTAGGSNISASLDSGNFTRVQLRALSRAAVGGMALPGTVKRRVFTDGKGEVKINLILSEAGGDEFTVKAYIPKFKGKGKELASETYQVWRRLYFQVSRFKSGPKGAGRTGTLAEIPALDWGPVVTEFAARNHNIELVDDSGTDLIKRHCNILDADPDYKSSARDGYVATREPVTIRAVLVNQIGTPAEEELVFPVVKEDEEVEQSTNSPLWTDESMALKKDFIIEAKWRYKGEAVAAERDISLDCIEAPDIWTIKIHFKDIPKRHLVDFWRKATVRLKLRVSTGSTNGVSWYNTVWMANENMHSGVRAVGDKQQTTIHEVGHYINMAAAAQSTHYTGHDHQGPHCYTGLSATDVAKASYRSLGGTCIMFGEGGGPTSKRLPKFCTVCDPFVRTSAIPAKRMPATW
jgi:hypothetical protein